MKTEAQVRSELLARYEDASKVEREYPDGLITKADDQEKLQGILTEIKGLESELTNLTDARERRDMISAGVSRYQAAAQAAGSVSAPRPVGTQLTKSLGDYFVDSEEYQEAEHKGLFDSPKGVPSFAFRLDGVSLIETALNQKTLLQTGDSGVGIAVGEPFESRTRRPGYLPLLYAPHTFLDLVNRVPTDEEMIEWVKENVFTNNAAFVAEATATTGTSGTKPESAFSFSVEHTHVKDLAHWIPVTNKMLRNKAAIRGMINQRLVFGLDAKLESEIVTGNGTDLTGILAAGILTQALGSDSVQDAIYKALVKCRVTGLSNPNVILMHPNDWSEIRLARTLGVSGGDYLLGPPIMQGPQVLWGTPVVLTASIAENTCLVGDMNQVTLFDRMRTVVRTGLIDAQFIRNMQTVLAECAVALVVWRPSAFCVITGV